MTEYVYCVDSANFITNPNQESPIENPTNDIIVKVQMSTDKVIFKAIELVSLELPASQRLIEDKWSRIYFMTPLVFSSTSLSTRSFQILDGNNQAIEAVLPVTDNMIVSLDDTDPTTPVFTTMVNHLLETAGRAWSRGKTWYVYGTTDEFKVTKIDGKLQDNVTVLSPTQFSVSGFLPGTVWKQNLDATRFGYLHAQPISSYEYLAPVLTRLLWMDYQHKVGPIYKAPFLVQFQPTKGHFAVRLNPMVESRVSDTTFFSRMLVVHGSFVEMLGFCSGTHKLYMEDIPFCTGDSGCRTKQTKQKIVTSCAGDTLGICDVRLNPGNYLSPNDLVQELNVQFNRMWLDVDDGPYMMTLADTSGVKYCVTVPPGFYTPDSLSLTLTELFVTAMPTHDIVVDFIDTDVISDKFRIRSDNNTMFGLEFKEVDTNIQSRLGFQSNRYTGGDTYVSNTRFEYSRCAGSTRFSESIIKVTESAPGSRQLMLTGSLPPPINMTFATFGDASDKLQAMSVSNAHGFQIGDTVLITIVGFIHHCKVVEIVSGMELVVDLGALALNLAPGTVGAASQIGYADVSIMLAPRQNNSFLPAVLGFPPVDVAWAPDFKNTLIAPYTMDLNGRFYIMVQVVDPPGSARVEQLDEDGHNNTGFIAKAVLINTTVRTIDKGHPSVYKFFPPRRITQLHFRFVNPDSTLYQLKLSLIHI